MGESDICEIKPKICDIISTYFLIKVILEQEFIKNTFKRLNKREVI